MVAAKKAFAGRIDDNWRWDCQNGPEEGSENQSTQMHAAKLVSLDGVEMRFDFVLQKGLLGIVELCRVWRKTLRCLRRAKPFL